MVLRTQEGEVFWLGSDAIVPTWSAPGWTRSFTPDLVSEIVADVDDFFRVASTIGAYILFPRNGSGRSGSTLNQLRGTTPGISDRFDLTVECIRRHYLNETSPLSAPLARYADYFRLFGDFQGYVEFFLLQDLVTDDYSAVKFFSPWADFNSPPVPNNMATYLAYRELAIGFIEARNQRIRAWWIGHRDG